MSLMLLKATYCNGLMDRWSLTPPPGADEALHMKGVDRWLVLFGGRSCTSWAPTAGMLINIVFQRVLFRVYVMVQERNRKGEPLDPPTLTGM